MRKFSSLTIIFGASILCAFILRDGLSASAAQGGKGSEGKDKRADITALYQKQCAKCHGPDGKGIQALEPPDFTDAKWQATRTDQEFTDAIQQGKGVMPGFKELLSAQEVRALVQHVRAFAPSVKTKKK
jgi:mono/diheme cytochrome c family protein